MEESNSDESEIDISNSSDDEERIEVVPEENEDATCENPLDTDNNVENRDNEEVPINPLVLAQISINNPIEVHNSVTPIVANKKKKVPKKVYDKFGDIDDPFQNIRGSNYDETLEIDWKTCEFEELSSGTNRSGARRVKSTTRKPFLGEHQGAVGEFDGLTTPLQYFTLFVTEEIMNEFVRVTNIYGSSKEHNKEHTKFRKTDITEMRKFFGLIMYIGLVRVPSLVQMWADCIIHQPFVASVMSRNRFMELQKYLHFVDASTITPTEREKRNKSDGFWPITTLLEKLAILFQQYYRCGQDFNIDEQCILMKGTHRCKCFNPNKPNKFHFKLFCLNCSSNGYQLNMFMYQGKDEIRPDTQSATLYPCMRLLDSPVYHHKNHILFTDNWYSSIPLLLEMNDLGIQFCGTIKSNRAGLPKDDRMVKTGKAAKDRGVMQGYVGTFGDEKVGKKLFYTEWMDSKLVMLLSSYESMEDTCQRRTKPDADLNTTMTLTRPSIIGDYNNGMGGTDAIDQKLSYYRPKLRYRKWPKKLIFHLIWLCITNSHIIYKEVMNCQRGHPSYELQGFMMNLCRQLCDQYEPVHVQNHARILCVPVIRKQLNGCNPRKVCAVCRIHLVQTYCIVHNVPVCLKTNLDLENACWENHQNEGNL